MEQRGLGTVREERASRGKKRHRGCSILQSHSVGVARGTGDPQGPTEEAESWRAMKASVLGAQAPTSGVRTE